MYPDQTPFLSASRHPQRRVCKIVSILAVALCLLGGIVAAQSAWASQPISGDTTQPATKGLPPALPSAVPTLPRPLPTAPPTPCVVRFADVPPNAVYYPYVVCLVCRGVLSGYTCGGVGEPCNAQHDPYFRPNLNITRGQMAKVVANAAGYVEVIPSSRQTFGDVPHSNPFWIYIERTALHNVISGYNSSPPCETAGACFLPNNPVTRGQAAKLVSNAAGYTNAIPSTQQTFSDVPSNSSFWIYIERVALRGIISGYTCDGVTINPCTEQVETCPGVYFRPCLAVTRGQTAKFISNAFYPSCETP